VIRIVFLWPAAGVAARPAVAARTTMHRATDIVTVARASERRGRLGCRRERRAA
jgi:hypothetical protein